MPLLLYCVTEERVGKVSVPGVRGRKVDSIAGAALRCFFSSVEEEELEASETVREDALQFHAVIQELFHHTPVIPFRYPTVVESAAFVAQFLEQHASQYTSALASHRDDVQMDVRLLVQQPRAAGNHHPKDGHNENGQLLESAAATCRETVGPIAVKWHQKPTREGLRCYALVRRNHIHNFQQQIQAAALPARVKAVISGPWPTTEFLRSEPQ